jgi:hypothetical protein
MTLFGYNLDVSRPGMVAFTYNLSTKEAEAG